MKFGIVNRSKSSLFPYQAWPTVCKDENGVLYATCSGHRLGHLCPFGKNLMFISRDEGESWSSPIIINDTELECDVYEGSNTVAVGIAAVESAAQGGMPVVPRYIRK